jgi:phage tail sheath protein FI
MAELTFKSPGVSSREIDLSGPTTLRPQGTPAGVVGTAQKGRAFVPITFATYQDFVAEFGATDGKKFGPLAMNEWMKNARAGTYVRVLGVGDAKQRQSGGNNSGRVNNAGFVVGAQQVWDNGLVGYNRYALRGNGAKGTTAATPGALGRTFLLGSFMTQKTSSTVLSDAGITISDSVAFPILRGVLMSASGVHLALSSTNAVNNTPSQTTAAQWIVGASLDAGASVGTCKTTNGKQSFVMLLNGHVPSAQYSNVVTASLDPTAADHFNNVFNTDPEKMQEAGHLLYANYDIHPSIATPDATGKATAGNTNESVLLLTGTRGRNSGNSSIPNYENFEDRFRAAHTPWFISQKFGGRNKKLFRVHAIDDGASANDLFKITIENIAASNNNNQKFGKFDLLIRDFYDTDQDPAVFEAFRGLSLDPSSDRYIARVIGDLNMYYDFDQPKGRQKLRIEGSHPNVSRYIRVEVDVQVERGSIADEAIPVGFQGPHHLLTAGTTAGGEELVVGAISGSVGLTLAEISALQERPIPMRNHLVQGVGLKKKLNAALCWGVQWEVQNNAKDLNASNRVDPSLASFTKYFPRHQDTWRNVSVGNNSGKAADGSVILDCDAFNNNKFTLENIQVSTGSTDRPLANRWGAALYRRTSAKNGTLTDSDGTVYPGDVTRFLDPSKDFNHLPSRKYLKFTVFAQGGFDGLNHFDKEKAALTDIAARREFGDETNQGGVVGSTIVAYRKGIDVIEEKADVDIQLLAIPGLRHASVTDYAIDAVEDRFDAMYIMDIEEKDNENAFMTGSNVQLPSVTYTVNNHESRNLDSSFAAAYYPDVVITDPVTKTNLQCPPSVAVLGAFALNDAVAHPWFAPAGFSRGSLKSVIESQVKLNRSNLDALYEADINPITSFPHTPGVVVFGQKTLQAAESALDRVNVRRLLIEIRRRVKRIANGLLFEPNRAETLARFSASVNPILQQIQAQQGLDRFKVQIDTTTTTQADVENNTIRGKIFLQPTRSVEFISLDFVVTNQGAEI